MLKKDDNHFERNLNVKDKKKVSFHAFVIIKFKIKKKESINNKYKLTQAQSIFYVINAYEMIYNSCLSCYGLCVVIW